MNTSGPIDCIPFMFLLPCRRPSADRPIEILVQKYTKGGSPESIIFERSFGSRAAYQLIAFALTNAAWESGTTPGDGKLAVEGELQPEDLLDDLIRIMVTKKIGAQDYIVLGPTMPFYFRPSGRGEIPSLAIGISLQIIGNVNPDFVWINLDEFKAAETMVLVTPATRSQGFEDMIRQAVTRFEQRRMPDSFARLLLPAKNHPQVT